MPEAPSAHIRRTCTVCGSTTNEEAETRCKVARDMTDEYYCTGGATEWGPDDGYLYFPNPAYAEWIDRKIDAERGST